MTLSTLPWIALFALSTAPQDVDGLPRVAQEGRTPIPVVQEPTTLVIYDVRDLVEFAPAKPPEGEPAKASDAELLAETEALAAFLAQHVEPPFSTEAGTSETVRAAGVGSVIAMARPAQQAWIERVLNLHRSQRFVMHIRVKYVQGPQGAFDEYGKQGTVSFLESKEELDAFLKFAEGPGMLTVGMPQVIAFNRQRCSVELMKEVAYVKEYRLIVVEPGEQEIADPVVDVIREGYSFEACAALLEPDLYALDLELTRAQIQRPIPTRKMRLSPAIPNEVEVSTPVCLSSTIEASLVLAKGTAVVFLSPSNEDGRDLACILTVETVVPQALEGFAPPEDGERHEHR